MKRKIQKWMIKAPVAAFCLFTVPFCSVIILLYVMIDGPIWLSILFSLLFAFAIYIFIDTAAIGYLQEPAKSNNLQCDPYPLLKETEELLALKLKPNARLNVTLSHITALLNIGKEEEAEKELAAMDIGLTVNPLLQFNYYALSAECALERKRSEHARFCLSQMEQIGGRLKPEGAKKEAAEILLNVKVGLALEEKDAEGALALLAALHSTVPTNLVGRALYQGMAYMALEKWELAEMWLHQVVQTGNRLYAVEEAKALLKEIEAKREQ